MCDIESSDEVMGPDPCPGIFKFVRVAYKCELGEWNHLHFDLEAMGTEKVLQHWHWCMTLPWFALLKCFAKGPNCFRPQHWRSHPRGQHLPARQHHPDLPPRSSPEDRPGRLRQAGWGDLFSRDPWRRTTGAGLQQMCGQGCQAMVKQFFTYWVSFALPGPQY